MKLFVSISLITVFFLSTAFISPKTSNGSSNLSCYEDIWFYDDIQSDCNSSYYMKVYKIRCSAGAVKQFYYWNGPTSVNPFSACPAIHGYYERIIFATDPYLGDSETDAINELCACR
jgi:hypothetical protein